MTDLNFNEYHDRASSFKANDLPEAIALATWALGLTGESGEVADIIKKHIGQGHPLDDASMDKIAEKLGDILWCIAVMASEIGIDLNEVAALNLKKLERRYPEGFSSERSINRSEEGLE
jgi:NTP pyrophosphatase (non-canonical NTP hydrolase)